MSQLVGGFIHPQILVQDKALAALPEGEYFIVVGPLGPNRLIPAVVVGRPGVWVKVNQVGGFRGTECVFNPKVADFFPHQPLSRLRQILGKVKQFAMEEGVVRK